MRVKWGKEQSSYTQIKGGEIMIIQEKMYSVLFNAVTDALQLLEKENSDSRVQAAVKLLQEAQISSEELFLMGEDRAEKESSEP